VGAPQFGAPRTTQFVGQALRLIVIQGLKDSFLLYAPGGIDKEKTVTTHLSFALSQSLCRCSLSQGNLKRNHNHYRNVICARGGLFGSGERPVM
jgi:hypothetical protein